ncbi:MAG: hypothetical protein ACLQBK_02390 [Candidatus Sulfotelmatobacter sp.]
MHPPRFSLGAVVRVLCIVLLLPVAVLPASKNFVKPVAKAAFNYPAHDLHRDEKVAIAADPYDTAEKAKIFSVDFAGYGFLPVFFVVTNDGDQPVSLANMEIEVTTGDHSKLTPTSPDDIYRRLSNPRANTRPNPFPLPRNSVKGTITQKQKDEIESAQFAARAVEPHTTQSGFLFFDVGGISSPLAGALMDITGVADAKGKELLFFEIAMDKYLNAPPN